MCNRFRSVVGKEWKPGDSLPLELVDGTPAGAFWTGFPPLKNLDGGGEKTLATALHKLAIMSLRSPNGMVALREIVFGPAPQQARLLFIVEPAFPGKSYRLARMQTAAASPTISSPTLTTGDFLFLGVLKEDGSIEEIEPIKDLPVRKREKPQLVQGTLF